MNTLHLKIPDMACAACAETITKAVVETDPKATVKADLETKQVEVTTEATTATVRQIVIDAGYTLA